MASKHHEGNRACGCNRGDANCVGLTVRRLSQERVRELVVEVDAMPGGYVCSAFLATQGVDLSGEQQTKTKTALTYFSRGLKVTATADA
jgi:hypothetical protein